MLGKRGIGGEVDWMIAIGMFFLFMGTVFVLFKPGIKPVFDHEALQTIVAENFVKETEWEIHKQPIFLEPIRFTQGWDVPRGAGVRTCTTTDCLTEEDDVQFFLDGTSYATPDPNRQEPSGAEFPLLTTFFKDDTATSVDESAAAYVKERILLYRVGEGERGFAFAGSVVLDDWEWEQLEGSPLVAITGAVTGAGKKAQEACSPNAPAGGQCKHGLECKFVDEVQQTICVPVRGAVAQPEDESPGSTQSADETGDDEELKDHGKDDEYKKERGKLEKQSRENIGEFPINYAIAGQKLVLETKLKAGEKKRYILVYSKEQINHVPEQSLRVGNEEHYACIIPDYPPETTYAGAQSKCRAKYGLGVRETVRGISLKKFVLLGTSCGAGKPEYECVKEAWGYPLAKDFRVDVTSDDPALNNFKIVVNDVVIPVDATVRVRNFNHFVLTEEGLKVPVTVSIKVW